MSGVASTDLDISNPMADDADALVGSGLRLPMGNQRVAGQRARAHTFSGESNDLLAVIERLRTRRASLGQSILLPGEAEIGTLGWDRRRRSWAAPSATTNSSAMYESAQIENDVMGEILGLEESEEGVGGGAELDMDESCSTHSMSQEDDDAQYDYDDDDEDPLPAGQRRVSAASLDSVDTARASSAQGQRFSLSRGFNQYPLDAGTGRRGVRLSDLRKSIGGMRKYTDSSLRALGSK
ncbi:hypothetical protein FOZ63_010176, partial [Perkinsus olseni]